MPTPAMVTINGTLAPFTGARRVKFYIPTPIRYGAGPDVLLPQWLEASVSQLNGTFSIQVPGSNDPAWSPQNWTYKVVIEGDNLNHQFDAQVPYDVTPLDFSDLLPAVSPSLGALYAAIGHGHEEFLTLEDYNEADLVSYTTLQEELGNYVRDDDASAITGLKDFQAGLKTNNRFSVSPTGGMDWSPASGTPDVNFYRAGAGVLQTDYAINAASLRVNGVDIFQLANLLTTGEEVLPRDDVAGEVALVSGVAYFSFFTARKTETITQIRTATGSTAASGLTVARIAVYSTNGTTLTQVANTAHDASLWIAANTMYPKTFAASWNKVAGQRYALCYLAVGTTPPNLEAVQVRPNSVSLAPRITGELSGQANLPAGPTEASLASSFRRFQGIFLP